MYGCVIFFRTLDVLQLVGYEFKYILFGQVKAMFAVIHFFFPWFSVIEICKIFCKNGYSDLVLPWLWVPQSFLYYKDHLNLSQ
jgi:hypothetical protein